jgi:hypothetical protein
MNIIENKQLHEPFEEQLEMLIQGSQQTGALSDVNRRYREEYANLQTRNNTLYSTNMQFGDYLVQLQQENTAL